MTNNTPSSEAAPAPEGRPLREIRAERLLSMRDLARLAEVNLSTVYLIEAGRTTPRGAVIRRLSAALGVDPMAVAEFRRAVRRHAGRG